MEDYVILNFDLGLKGDYESLYRLLDNLNAQDCGNSTCVFRFNYSGRDLDYNEKFSQLRKELEEKVSLKKGDRIYSIVHNKNGVPRGTFLYGHRQRPIWEGYGDKKEDDGLPF